MWVLLHGWEETRVQGCGGSRRDPGESPEKHCYSRKDQRQVHCDEGKGEVVLEARGQVPGKRQVPPSRGSNQRGYLKQLENCWGLNFMLLAPWASVPRDLPGLPSTCHHQKPERKRVMLGQGGGRAVLSSWQGH